MEAAELGPNVTLRERLARFLCEEDQFRRRNGLFWDELSAPDKITWREEADRYVAHLAERKVGVRKSRTHCRSTLGRSDNWWRLCSLQT